MNLLSLALTENIIGSFKPIVHGSLGTHHARLQIDGFSQIKQNRKHNTDV